MTEQAYHYHPGAPADPVPLPESLREQEKAARTEMLETLAEFDDHLLEELLEDIEPPQEEIFQDLKMELGQTRLFPFLLESLTKTLAYGHYYRLSCGKLPNLKQPPKIAVLPSAAVHRWPKC